MRSSRRRDRDHQKMVSRPRPILKMSAATETQQLSFAEVMQLVQEGKEIPGVMKVDVQPSNQSPTPSQMQRVLYKVFGKGSEQYCVVAFRTRVLPNLGVLPILS
uniref:Peroxisomal membrane protein PEX14-like KPWE domain-containing protein n=1 Tax=Cyprinodon variegatus TaxID=28743 RepID=A0A3Q2DES1_CYPVA